MWTLRRQAKSSSSDEPDFLSLCKDNVRSIQTLATHANLLNRRQCLHLSTKLSNSFEKYKLLVSLCAKSANLLRPNLANLYRYLEKAKLLVKQCGEEDWCAAAAFQLQNENAFREILLDVALCYNVLYHLFKVRTSKATWNGMRNCFEALRMPAFFQPACPRDVQNDLEELQKRLKTLAHEQYSSRLLSLRLFKSGRRALKQCLARYLLRKVDCRSKQLKHNTLDMASAISWEKESEPLETWGGEKILGVGSAGYVSSTKWLGIPCAKKIFHGRPAQRSFMKEASILANLKHPCIVNFICCGDGKEKGDCFIAMELMEKSLSDLIEDRKDAPFSLSVAVDIMVQIARGLWYLHNVGVAHRDLKPQNVVVSRLSSPHLHDFFCVKLVDFGVSKTKVEASKSDTMTAAGIGTTRYRAPEVHPQANPDGKGKAVWLKADVYSFAMTCAHILTLQTPLGDVRQMEFYDELMKGRRPELPGDCPLDLVALIKNCWDPDPRSRPSFMQICTRLEILRHELWRELELRTVDLSGNEVGNGFMAFEFIEMMLEQHSLFQRRFEDKCEIIMQRITGDVCRIEAEFYWAVDWQVASPEPDSNGQDLRRTRPGAPCGEQA